MDPQDGDHGRTVGECEKHEEVWKRVWYDTDGADYARVRGWYMVLNYAGRRFADEHEGGVDHAPSGS